MLIAKILLYILLAIFLFAVYEIWAMKQIRTYSQPMTVSSYEMPDNEKYFKLTCISNNDQFLLVDPHEELGEYLKKNNGGTVEVQIIEVGYPSLISGGYIWHKIDELDFAANHVISNKSVICKDNSKIVPNNIVKRAQKARLDRPNNGRPLT